MSEDKKDAKKVHIPRIMPIPGFMELFNDPQDFRLGSTPQRQSVYEHYFSKVLRLYDANDEAPAQTFWHYFRPETPVMEGFGSLDVAAALDRISGETLVIDQGSYYRQNKTRTVYLVGPEKMMNVSATCFRMWLRKEQLETEVPTYFDELFACPVSERPASPHHDIRAWLSLVDNVAFTFEPDTARLLMKAFRA